MELARGVFLSLSKECQAVAERGVRVSDECRRALETSVNALELVLNATKAPAAPPKAAVSQMDEAPPPPTAACQANEECPVARAPSAVVAADDPSGDAALELAPPAPQPDAAAGLELTLANKECSGGAQACAPFFPTAGGVASGGLLLSPARDAVEDAWLPGLSFADTTNLFSSPVKTTYAPGADSIASLFGLSPTAEPWFMKEVEEWAPPTGLDAFMSSPALEEALRSAPPPLPFGLFFSPGVGGDAATGMEEDEGEEDEEQDEENPDMEDVPLEELSRKQLLTLAKKVTGRDYKTANYGRDKLLRLLRARM